MVAVLNREPGLLFDVLETGTNNATIQSHKPIWCVCNNCLENEDPQQNICCGYRPEHCISTVPVRSIILFIFNILILMHIYIYTRKGIVEL